jgi:putative peptidoglycan lipid II flippase
MRSLLKSTFVVSLMTITSRVTGFLRDLSFAHVFGAAAGLDAFLVAFRIPNFLRRLFAEGAFSQAFVPVLSEYRQNQDELAIRIFLSRMAGAMVGSLFLVTVLAVLVTPWLIWLFAPGFVKDPTRYDLTVTMLRITFPYIFFISLTAYVSGILNSYSKFSIPAFTPNLLNFALIAASIFFAPYFAKPVVALAWGVFFGGVAQLLFQLPFLWRLNLLTMPTFLWRDSGVKKVLRLMLPAVFGVSVAQIGLLVDTFFASFLKQGSVSWFYFSDRITSFPLGVFGVAIATVILPHLSRKYVANSVGEFSKTLDWALRMILIVALPAAVGIFVLAKPILATLLQYGEFKSFDVEMAARSLIAFTVGVPAFMLVKVLASGFYSRQNIKTPVKVAVLAVLSNIVLDAILIFPLAHAGLALATSLTSSLNAFLLIWILVGKKFFLPSPGWKKFFMQLGFASIAMTLFLFFFRGNFSLWVNWSWFSRALHLTILCAGAVITYLITLFISGIRPRDFFWQDDKN